MQKTILTLLNSSSEDYRLFESAATLKEMPKNSIISYPRKVNRKMFFIDQGLMRGYRLVNGQEYTHYFYTENWFATDYQSYLTEQESDLYIQALTDVTYYEFDKSSLIDLFQKYHEFEKLGRIIAEKAYLKMVERLVDFQTNDLRARYHKLIQSHPQLFLQVPQKMIASYLGVAEQSLSRIKSKLIG